MRITRLAIFRGGRADSAAAGIVTVEAGGVAAVVRPGEDIACPDASVSDASSRSSDSRRVIVIHPAYDD
jgi:hypothetical protein